MGCQKAKGRSLYVDAPCHCTTPCLQSRHYSLLVSTAEHHVRFGISHLYVLQGPQCWQLSHWIHALEFHFVFESQQPPLHILAARHLPVELPRNCSESFLGGLHPSVVVTILQFDTPSTVDISSGLLSDFLFLCDS